MKKIVISVLLIVSFIGYAVAMDTIVYDEIVTNEVATTETVVIQAVCRDGHEVIVIKQSGKVKVKVKVKPVYQADGTTRMSCNE